MGVGEEKNPTKTNKKPCPPLKVQPTRSFPAGLEGAKPSPGLLIKVTVILNSHFAQHFSGKGQLKIYSECSKDILFRKELSRHPENNMKHPNPRVIKGR